MVIDFIGSDHKNGTTLLCMETAKYLANKYPHKKILVLKSQQCIKDEYFKEPFLSIYNLADYISDEYIDFEAVEKNARLDNNLFFAGGMDSVLRDTDFLPEHILNEISILDEHFDFILCDCGCDLSLGLTLGSILASDIHFLVVNQNELSVRKCEITKKYISLISEKEISVVINRYNSFSVYDKEYISKRIGLDDVKTFYERKSKMLFKKQCRYDIEMIMEGF